MEPGVGSRLQHTKLGPGVVIANRASSYIISFINHGIEEIEKNDPDLDEIIPENYTPLEETDSIVEERLLRILRYWNGIGEIVPIGDRWKKGMISIQPADSSLKPKEVPVEVFFHKIVMLRDRLRVLEQTINAHKTLTEADKLNLQQYITRIYGSLTTFNVLFREREDWFVGDRSGKEE